MLDILGKAPVIPVIVIEDAAQAVPLARALVAGGMPVLEITLRTRAALAAIRAVVRDVPEAIVGAGTLLTPADLAQAREAGARFGVSPGLNPELLDAARGWNYLPGVMTPSDMMAAQAAGYRTLKFFPAQPAGGVPALRALSGPFPELRFCPTGGISLATAPDYLALPNVICVGGTWLAPASRIGTRDWAGITQLARQASALRKSPPP